MGSVFEAVQEDIERRVALKLLKPGFAQDPEVVTRFLNEARIVNRIAHPSLVQISDHGRTPDGAVYLVMEFLRGETLAARLHKLRQSHERMPIEQVLCSAWQIADALTAAHEKGVVHCDLKPDNLMLVPDPVAVGGERAKVLDFGVAKLLQSTQALTVKQRLMGTPHYMAPEQIRTRAQVDGQADVYSLGVILFRMLSGRLPFEGTQLEVILGQHLFAVPPCLTELAPHLPGQLVELVEQLLDKSPVKRPSMADACAVLRGLLLAGHEEPADRAPPAALPIQPVPGALTQDLPKALTQCLPEALTQVYEDGNCSTVKPTHRAPVLRAPLFVCTLCVGVVGMGVWLVQRYSRVRPAAAAIPAMHEPSRVRDSQSQVPSVVQGASSLKEPVSSRFGPELRDQDIRQGQEQLSPPLAHTETATAAPSKVGGKPHDAPPRSEISPSLNTTLGSQTTDSARSGTARPVSKLPIQPSQPLPARDLTARANIEKKTEEKPPRREELDPYDL